MMSSPIYTICWTGWYLLIVWAAPTALKNVKPLNLRPILISYNFAMVILNLYIFVEVSLVEQTARKQLYKQPINK